MHAELDCPEVTRNGGRLVDLREALHGVMLQPEAEVIREGVPRVVGAQQQSIEQDLEEIFVRQKQRLVPV